MPKLRLDSGVLTRAQIDALFPDPFSGAWNVSDEKQMVNRLVEMGYMLNPANPTAPGSGDMAAATYDTDANGVVDNAEHAQSLTSLNDILDVNTAGVISGEFLTWNGTSWIGTAGGGGSSRYAFARDRWQRGYPSGFDCRGRYPFSGTYRQQ